MDNTTSQIPVVDQSNSNGTVKFSQEEMQDLGQLQAKYQQNIFQFGQLHMEQLSVKEQMSQLEESYKKLLEHEEHLKKEYFELQKSEEAILNKLTAKYGEGSLDPKSGTFTPKK